MEQEIMEDKIFQLKKSITGGKFLFIGAYLRDISELQNWLLKYWEISKRKNLIVKAISGFYIALADIKIEPFWVEFLQDNINVEITYQPNICLPVMDSYPVCLVNKRKTYIGG
jgi:hypothetical protein